MGTDWIKTVLLLSNLHNYVPTRRRFVLFLQFVLTHSSCSLSLPWRSACSTHDPKFYQAALVYEHTVIFILASVFAYLFLSRCVTGESDTNSPPSLLLRIEVFFWLYCVHCLISLFMTLPQDTVRWTYKGTAWWVPPSVIANRSVWLMWQCWVHFSWCFG